MVSLFSILPPRIVKNWKQQLLVTSHVAQLDLIVTLKVLLDTVQTPLLNVPPSGTIDIFYISMEYVHSYSTYYARYVQFFQPKLPLDLRSLVISLTNTYVHQKVRLHEATKSKHIHDNWKDTLSHLHYVGLRIFPDLKQATSSTCTCSLNVVHFFFMSIKHEILNHALWEICIQGDQKSCLGSEWIQLTPTRDNFSGHP